MSDLEFPAASSLLCLCDDEASAAAVFILTADILIMRRILVSISSPSKSHFSPPIVPETVYRLRDRCELLVELMQGTAAVTKKNLVIRLVIALLTICFHSVDAQYSSSGQSLGRRCSKHWDCSLISYIKAVCKSPWCWFILHSCLPSSFRKGIRRLRIYIQQSSHKHDVSCCIFFLLLRLCLSSIRNHRSGLQLSTRAAMLANFARMATTQPNYRWSFASDHSDGSSLLY